MPLQPLLPREAKPALLADDLDELPVPPPPSSPAHIALVERARQEGEYTQIVEAFKTYYIQKCARNQGFKLVFFVACIALLALVLLGFLAVGVLLATRSRPWQNELALLGSAAATCLAALLQLPKIVAQHLFPAGEDHVLIDLILALKQPEASAPRS